MRNIRSIPDVDYNDMSECWRGSASDRAKEAARLLRLIRAFVIAAHGIYGDPRFFLDLSESGETCSKHRAARLKRENNLRSLHGHRTRRVSVTKPLVLISYRLPRQFRVSCGLDIMA